MAQSHLLKERFDMTQELASFGVVPVPAIICKLSIATVMGMLSGRYLPGLCV